MDRTIKPHFNSKHSHLTEKVMKYFLNHSAKECCDHFNLTMSNFKSLMTRGYRRQDLKHLRKDTRTKREWDLNDWLFTVRRAGLLSRNEIAAGLGRGSYHAIKDRMKKCGGVSQKFLNGMPLLWAETIWKRKDLFENLALHGTAGPSGKRGEFNFRIIPWIECEKLCEIMITPKKIKSCIRSMAKFQRFIFMRKDDLIIKKLKQIGGTKCQKKFKKKMNTKKYLTQKKLSKS